MYSLLVSLLVLNLLAVVTSVVIRPLPTIYHRGPLRSHPQSLNKPTTRFLISSNSSFIHSRFTSSLSQFSSKLLQFKDSKSFPHFVAGIVAGAVECLVGHPLDTIRVVIMSDKASPRAIPALLTALSSPRGFLNLYRGSSSELASSALAGSLLFGVNDLIKRFVGVSCDDDHIEHITGGLLFAAACTGFLDGVTSKPLEMIKLRQQGSVATLDQLMSNTGPSSSFAHCAREIFREGGYSAFMRGWFPTVVRESMGNVAFFAAYHFTKNYFTQQHRMEVEEKDSAASTTTQQHQQQQQQQQHGVGGQRRGGGGGKDRAGVILLAGAAAGVAYVVASHPLETASVLMQLDRPTVRSLLPGSIPSYQFPSTLSCLRQVVQDGGWMELYRGSAPTIARAIPAYAASLWAYEATLDLMEHFNRTVH